MIGGDAYIFEGEDMVALVGGVWYQAMPRSLLNKHLPLINGTAARPKSQTLPSLHAMPSHSKTQQPSLVEDSALALTKGMHDAKSLPSHPQDGDSSIITAFMSIVADELGLKPSETFRWSCVC